MSRESSRSPFSMQLVDLPPRAKGCVLQRRMGKERDEGLELDYPSRRFQSGKRQVSVAGRMSIPEDRECVPSSCKPEYLKRLLHMRHPKHRVASRCIAPLHKTISELETKGVMSGGRTRTTIRREPRPHLPSSSAGFLPSNSSVKIQQVLA